jgi:hypothetical protein
MVGVITSWDVLSHPISTIRCFGWRVFFRAVGPWQGRTFLSVVHDAGFLAPSTRLRPFQETMEAHVSYIVERIPELSPKLMLATRELRARFPAVRS